MACCGPDTTTNHNHFAPARKYQLVAAICVYAGLKNVVLWKVLLDSKYIAQELKILCKCTYFLLHTCILRSFGFDAIFIQSKARIATFIFYLNIPWFVAKRWNTKVFTFKSICSHTHNWNFSCKLTKLPWIFRGAVLKRTGRSLSGYKDICWKKVGLN